MTTRAIELDHAASALEQTYASPARQSITDLDRIIGANIRVQRARVGLTQAALGEAIGVTFQQIQKYENATNRISASRLFELSRIFKIDIRAFFHEG